LGLDENLTSWRHISAMQIRFKRILIKISGEFLGNENSCYNLTAMEFIVSQIQKLQNIGIEVAIVLGGGNIYRGRFGTVSREVGDQMGMLATIMNGLALRDFLEKSGISCCLQNSLGIVCNIDPNHSRRAQEALQNGKIVVFCGGTGLPFFSTDTASALRAIEIHAHALFKATKVDGIYDSDPQINPNATHFDHITYEEAVRLQLDVMDQEAFCLCRKHSLPILVFSLHQENALIRAVRGEKIGSLVHGNNLEHML
jgi:uridylate kinase